MRWFHVDIHFHRFEPWAPFRGGERLAYDDDAGTGELPAAQSQDKSTQGRQQVGDTVRRVDPPWREEPVNID